VELSDIPPDATVLVAERANGVERDDTGTSAPLRLRKGALEWGPARERLVSLGLRWDAAMNLLPGQPTRTASWTAADRARARQVAFDTAILAKEHEWRLVLVGARVCGAFGVRYEPLAWDEDRRTLVVPHPSGLCRWWNDMDNLRAAEVAFRRFVTQNRPG
jgi:hypothetical protein